MGGMPTGKFDRSRVRRLHAVDSDSGASAFNAKADVDWLLAFLDRFERLGWVPPKTSREREALQANDLLFHEFGSVSFYEFWVRGARDHRDPPLTIFLHLDKKRGTVRIIGIHLTNVVRLHHDEILKTIYSRAAQVDTILSR